MAKSQVACSIDIDQMHIEIDMHIEICNESAYAHTQIFCAIGSTGTMLGLLKDRPKMGGVPRSACIASAVQW